jgi:hypothetical protein
LLPERLLKEGKSNLSGLRVPSSLHPRREPAATARAKVLSFD